MYTNYQRDNSVVEDQCLQALTGTINFLNKEELQSFQNNEERLDGMINDLPQVKNLEDDKEQILASNKSIAEYNLGLQPRLEQGKAQLTVAYKKLTELQNDLDEQKGKLGSLSGQQELDTTLAVLQTEAAKSEETSEETAENFLEGDVPLLTFLPKYMAQRTEAHMRKTKVEKLQEIVRNAHSGRSGYVTSGGPESVPRGGVPSSYPLNNPGYNQHSSWQSQQTPYPLTNSYGASDNRMSMPQANNYFHKR